MSSTNQALSNLARSALKEDERRELDAVSVALGNSSRLLRLITFIGEKYLRGETDNLREYDIATEVFGRSKETFYGGEDAIVRVEAHRLRKRLKEYYAGPGKDHSIHISIPPGAYIPVFTRLPSDPTKIEREPLVAQPSNRHWSYPYGQSKLLVEQMLSWFNRIHGLRYASLRYFNVAGAHEGRGGITRGEAHEPETHLIPLVLDVALGRRASIRIFGDDYSTPDGTCVRDYIHVSDLAEAHVLALAALDSRAENDAYPENREPE